MQLSAAHLRLQLSNSSTELINMRFLFAQAEPTAAAAAAAHITHNFFTHTHTERGWLPLLLLLRRQYLALPSYPHDRKVGVARNGLHVCSVMFPCYTLPLFSRWLWFVWLTHSLSTCTHTSRLRRQLVRPQRLVTVYSVPAESSLLAGVFMANVTIKTRFNFAMANDKQPAQHANTQEHKHTRTHTLTRTRRTLLS